MSKTTHNSSISGRTRHEDEPEETVSQELTKTEDNKAEEPKPPTQQEPPQPEAPDTRNDQVKKADKFGERKVIAVAGDHQAVIAVCSDHSVWRNTYNSGLDAQWVRMPAIPMDDPRDPKKQTAKGEGIPAVES